MQLNSALLSFSCHLPIIDAFPITFCVYTLCENNTYSSPGILDFVKDICDIMDIQQPKSRPYHPQSQGKIERSHRTWKRKLEYDMAAENTGKYHFITTFITRVYRSES